VKLRGLCSETARNVGTGTTKAAVWTLTAAAVLVLLSTADVLVIRQIETDMDVFRSGVADVSKLVAAEHVDGAVCDRLSETATIEGSGAVREAVPLIVNESPNVAMATFEVSLGLASILGLDSPDPFGVWIENELASALMVEQGGSLSTPNGPMTVAGVFAWPNDGRDARFGFSVLVPISSSEQFDECWVRAWPFTDETSHIQRSVVTVSSDQGPAVVAQLNNSLGTAFDPNRLYRERVTRHSLWVAPIVVGAIGFVAVWRRVKVGNRGRAVLSSWVEREL